MPRPDWSEINARKVDRIRTDLLAGELSSVAFGKLRTRYGIGDDLIRKALLLFDREGLVIKNGNRYQVAA